MIFICCRSAPIAFVVATILLSLLFHVIDCQFIILQAPIARVDGKIREWITGGRITTEQIKVNRKTARNVLCSLKIPYRLSVTQETYLWNNQEYYISKFQAILTILSVSKIAHWYLSTRKPDDIVSIGLQYNRNPASDVTKVYI